MSAMWKRYQVLCFAKCLSLQFSSLEECVHVQTSLLHPRDAHENFANQVDQFIISNLDLMILHLADYVSVV